MATILTTFSDAGIFDADSYEAASDDGVSMFRIDPATLAVLAWSGRLPQGFDDVFELRTDVGDLIRYKVIDTVTLPT
jgi:hypothetical protein